MKREPTGPYKVRLTAKYKAADAEAKRAMNAAARAKLRRFREQIYIGGDDDQAVARLDDELDYRPQTISECREHDKLSARAYRAKDKEGYRAYLRARYAKNREAILARSAEKRAARKLNGA